MAAQNEARQALARRRASEDVSRLIDVPEVALATPQIQIEAPHEAAEPCIYAVLPGLTGATAIYFPAAPDRVVVEDVPQIDGRLNARRLAARIAQFSPNLAIIGCAAPQPRGSIRENFRGGIAYGAVCSVVALAGLPVTYARASSWKPSYGLDAGPGARQAARTLARTLFPASAVRFGDDVETARAEAALLARWAAERSIALPEIGERKS